MVQVSTQQGEHVAESLEFVPGATIKEEWPDPDTVVRRIVKDSTS